MEPWRLLAHQHWITLRIAGRQLRLCARCTGYALGLAAPALLRADPAALGPAAAPATALLAAPLALDWVTQKWGLRQSTNPLRLATGALAGLAVYTLHGLGAQGWETTLLAAALLIVSAGQLGRLMRRGNP